MEFTNVLLYLANALDTQPNKVVDLHTVRGYARKVGVQADWLDLLPDPAGAHHSEYAARLRDLAGGQP